MVCQHQLAAGYQSREVSARCPDQHACLGPGSGLNSSGVEGARAGSDPRGPDLTYAHRPSTWPSAGADWIKTS